LPEESHHIWIQHNSLLAEQKGCHSGSKECKDQKLISETISENVGREERI